MRQSARQNRFVYTATATQQPLDKSTRHVSTYRAIDRLDDRFDASSTCSAIIQRPSRSSWILCLSRKRRVFNHVSHHRQISNRFFFLFSSFRARYLESCYRTGSRRRYDGLRIEKTKAGTGLESLIRFEMDNWIRYTSENAWRTFARIKKE